MAYADLINASLIPNDFSHIHKDFGSVIVNSLTYNINLDIDHNDHPFRKYATNDRNQNVRNLEDFTKNNNDFGEQMLIDYFRSNSIYHNWLQNLLDYFEDYADDLGFHMDE
jgi:hypothetical protein